MKYLVICLAVLGIGLFASCGNGDNGGPHCEGPAPICEPACAATEYCDGTTCKEMILCDPITCTGDGSDYCDVTTGNCVAMPEACDPPTCAADGTEYCDNGTCKKLPVCDPACVAPEVCVP